jgi:serine/threonine protein phosphatase 1
MEWIENGRRARLWDDLEAAVCIGNVVFVHAGVDPQAPLDEFLAIPKEVIPADGRHWARIEGPFLAWTAGFGGRIIVHGHTPPEKHQVWTGMADPHVLHDAKLCVDGGSAVTGIVTGAQIEAGRSHHSRVRQRG